MDCSPWSSTWQNNEYFNYRQIFNYESKSKFINFCIKRGDIGRNMRVFKHNQPQNKIKILDFTYTSQPSINNALPLQFSKIRLVIFIISCICSLGFVWLLAKWSARKKAIMLYSVCQVQKATDFLIEEEDSISGSMIVKRQNKYDVRRRSNVVSFTYHDRNFLFHDQKEVFLPIRYEDLGTQLDRLQKGKFQPYSSRSRAKLLKYYGINQIQLDVKNGLEVFIEEMLTPYEVFQLYAIILWIIEEYYIFSFLLLAYSMYTYWDNSRQVVINQKKLAEKSYFSSICKVLIKQRSNADLEQDNPGYNSEDCTIVEQIQMNNDDKKELNMAEQLIEVDNMKYRPYQSPKKQDPIQIRVQSIQSKNIIPGDIIILKEGEVVPCDCVLISGEAVVDESYISGQNYLVRKIQLENYEYSKDREKSFLLYLGTTITKIKANSSSNRSLNKSSIAHQSHIETFLQNKQVMCLVTQTNYNTQRGKYLRAIRYQKKPIDNFTRQSIYFIYIIIVITVVAFLALYPFIYVGQSFKAMLILFIDLLATSIPITLPTALGVGINFAQHRLLKVGIHSILPSNILSGGRATTIVLDSNKVLGKNYEVSSIVVGVKNNSIGNTYSSLSQFLDVNSLTHTESFMADPENKKKEIDRLVESGKMLIRSFSVCHSLQRNNNQISGIAEERHLYQFAETRYVDQDLYECLGENLKIRSRIYFKQKDKKLAVIADIQKKTKPKEIKLEFDENFMEEREDRQLDSSSSRIDQSIVFIKGPPQCIMKLCLEGTYPKNYLDYAVDISEKGFKIVSFAYKKISMDIPSSKRIQQLNEGFIFCGFALLQAEKKQDTIQTITDLRKAKMQLILVSQQKQLQTSSLALSNRLCSKNQLILCKLNGTVKCSGHLQWESDGSGNDLNEFILQSDSLIRNSYISINSKLYEELFMKRDEASCENIFKKTIIYNQMENRHIRNVYFQLDRRGKVTFAVGSGANVSQCAHLSLELERGECSMLSSFHTNEKSLKSIKSCLIICRAALATNFHCVSMMILFSMVQFTTVVALYFRHQNISNSQMLYEDLFVTFPIFITLNMTSPVTYLSKQLPPQSFFSPRALASMIGQFIIQLLTQVIFISYVFQLAPFREEFQDANDKFLETFSFPESNLSLATFVLTNYLYLGIVLSTSVSKPFRKPFYTNPYYTLTLISLWLYNTAIVLVPEIVPSVIRPKNLTQEMEQVLVLAMLLGNLIMIVMYLYENCLVWISSFFSFLKPHNPYSIELRE